MPKRTKDNGNELEREAVHQESTNSSPPEVPTLVVAEISLD